MPTSKNVWICECGDTLSVEDWPYELMAMYGSPVCKNCDRDYSLKTKTITIDEEALELARVFVAPLSDELVRKGIVEQLSWLKPANGNARATAMYIHLHFTLRDALAASDFIRLLFEHANNS